MNISIGGVNVHRNGTNDGRVTEECWRVGERLRHNEVSSAKRVSRRTSLHGLSGDSEGSGWEITRNVRNEVETAVRRCGTKFVNVSEEVSAPVSTRFIRVLSLSRM